MTSRWSKRRKLHAEIDHYLDLINQQSISCDEPDYCSSENASQMVSLKNPASSDHESNICGMADSENSCQQSSQIGLDENILSICPDVVSLPIYDSQPELSTYLSTSDFDSSDTSTDADSVSDTYSSSDLKADLAAWAVECRITHSALKPLLLILNRWFSDLPKDPRTLLNTHTTVPVASVAGGTYCHLGIGNGLLHQLADSPIDRNSELNIQMNIDGLPLHKSSNSQLWPILGRIENFTDFGLSRKQADPFVIGVYHGYSKPSNVDEYLHEFIEEAHLLEREGLNHNGHHHDFKINSFVCDMPARSFIKCVKGHGAYGGCDRCVQTGVYLNKVTYPDSNACRRTDELFKQMADERHHIQVSPLSSLSIGMVTSFPIDYMHLVCLGVMRKLVSLWLTGPLKTRLGRQSVRELDGRVRSLKDHIPIEMKRKPRSFSEFERWKAVEFRLLLLYTGSSVLNDILPIQLYNNFLLLSVAMTIFLDPSMCHIYTDYAHTLLILFVQHFGELYGMDKITYNIHGLVHLSEDVRKYGALDGVSAFPFENFLGKLKKFVRKPSSPLEQIVRRLSEIHSDHQEIQDCASVLCGKGSHFDGPLQKGVNAVSQFREIKVKSFTIKLTDADRYVQLQNGDIIAVQNVIVDSSNKYGLIFKRCKGLECFFSYPLSSRDIGIVKFGHIGSHLHYCSLSEVAKKYVILPHKQWFIGVPLIHTNTD
jgi:hypothetical protein